MNRSINKLPQCSALLQPHKTSEHKTEVTLCLFERRLEYNTNSAQILWQKKTSFRKISNYKRWQWLDTVNMNEFYRNIQQHYMIVFPVA
jgi:hypothetical protein